MPTADEVVTKYTLDPSGYVAGGRKVVDTTRQTTHAIGGFKSFANDPILKSLPGVFGGLADVVSKVATGLLAAGGAFAAFAAYSINRYAEYNQLRLTFGGIFQDMAKADQMMAALEKYAMKSMFPEEALRRGALTLTQAKLSVEEFLPVLEILAAKSGDISLEGLLNAADVLRRIRGGQTTEGLGPEGVGRFGINKQDLMRLGGKFDKDGSFVGTWQEALALIKQASKESEGILKAMEGSETAQLSNAMEAVDKAVRSAGQSLAGTFLPMINTAASAATQMANSGVFTRIADEWGKLFNVTNEDGVLGFLATVAATLELLPGLIRDAGKAAFDTIMQLAPFLQIAERMGWIKDFTQTFSNALGVQARSQQILAEMKAGAASGQQTGPASFPSVADTGSAAHPIMKQIEENTKQTANNTGRKFDASRHIVGGGDLARMGVTPTEVHAMKTGHDKADKVLQALADLLTEAFNASPGKFYARMQRAG
jgi:hypothetical protein